MGIQESTFDFLRRKEVDLGLVRTYLSSCGYRVHELNQPGRHVVGKISDGSNLFFWKMASRPSLSKYIKNEYQWGRAMERDRRTKNWPLSLPRIYERGVMGRLQWLRIEYINGVSGAESPGVLTAAIKPLAVVIADIVRLSPLAPSRLTLRPHRGLQDRVRKRLASYAQRIGYGKTGSDLVP
jgi:hypothetical protein